MSLPKLLCISCCFAGIVLTTPAPLKCFEREILSFHNAINTACNASKHLPCWDESVTGIDFKVNCSQIEYQNIFRQIKDNLNQTTCKTTFSKTVISPVLLGNTSVPHSSSRSPATTLNEFCAKVQTYARYLYYQCSKELRKLCAAETRSDEKPSSS